METKKPQKPSTMTHLQNLINSILIQYSHLFSKSDDLKNFSVHILNSSGMTMVDVELHFGLQELKQGGYHQRKISDVQGYSSKTSPNGYEMSLSPMTDANSLKWILARSRAGLSPISPKTQ